MANADRAAWSAAFVEALLKLRPHLSARFASTIADNQYSATVDPQTAARAYHGRQLDQIAANNRGPLPAEGDHAQGRSGNG